MNSDILDFCDRIFEVLNRNMSIENEAQVSRRMKNLSCPAVDKIIFNGDTTVVFFVDGTKSTVKKDTMDTYDRKTAVVYAIIKRLFATDFVKGAANSNYINAIGKLIENKSFDKEESERIRVQKAKEAHEKHIAEQKKLSDRAFKRRVKNRIREIKVEEAARANLETEKISGHGKSKISQILTETGRKSEKKTTSPESNRSSRISQILAESKSNMLDPPYQKPRKPFSQFSQEEKRAYWRAQNAKRRALKK